MWTKEIIQTPEKQKQKNINHQITPDITNSLFKIHSLEYFFERIMRSTSRLWILYISFLGSTFLEFFKIWHIFSVYSASHCVFSLASGLRIFFYIIWQKGEENTRGTVPLEYLITGYFLFILKRLLCLCFLYVQIIKHFLAAKRFEIFTLVFCGMRREG